jgi:hypothetical protein
MYIEMILVAGSISWNVIISIFCVFCFKDRMSNRGRRDKMKNREENKKKRKRAAPTLSKAMFMFGKISTHI